MKLIKCDKHPDRDAVVTLYIAKYAPGFRPILVPFSSSGKIMDLCEECASAVSEDFVT